jgi:2-oxoacid:acceptor oxidoreductase gamma subunit (pyruvate/2-ketoisovalerate family)
MSKEVPNSGQNGLVEIRWHGRGGQGAISSARILAAAAYRAGFRGVTSAPSFGAERRGAPVTASTRLSAEPIRVFSQVEQPDVVVVLDDSLIEASNATAGLKPGGWLIVNSRHAPADLGVKGDFRIATADANGAAEEVGLIVSGTAMVNTAMLGAVARATELVALEHLQKSLAESFSAESAQVNYYAAHLTYERTQIKS